MTHSVKRTNTHNVTKPMIISIMTLKKMILSLSITILSIMTLITLVSIMTHSIFRYYLLMCILD
jgi:hypothetical protein